jgi:hypothetical protein
MGGLLPPPSLPAKRRIKLLTALSESYAVASCRESSELVINNVSAYNSITATAASAIQCTWPVQLTMCMSVRCVD